jgi:hypothetical protein
MTPTDISKILAKAAAFDQRTVGDADILAWLEALGDLDPADALAAVTCHYQRSEERLKPVHVIAGVAEIRRERRRRDRERRESEAAGRALTAAAKVRDRSADVAALVARARVDLPPGRLDVFRRPEWVAAERDQRWERAVAVAEPNPAFRGLPPPGGWPVPDVSDVDDGGESA